MTTQVESRSAIQQWAADLRLVTDTLVDMDPTIRELLVNSPDAGAAVQQLVEDAGPGLGPLVRNLDILNQVTIPRLDGVEQMLVTYPDVVSGGFTVVRRDADGVMRSHFGFVVNAGDPHACETGYIPTHAAAQPRCRRGRQRRCGPVPGRQRSGPEPRRRPRRVRFEHPG